MLITKLGSVLHSLQMLSPSLERSTVIPIFRSKGPESWESACLAQECPCRVDRLALEPEASGSQHCLKQRLPVDQIQPCPLIYGCFFATRAEVSSCHNDVMAHKPQIFTGFCIKSLLTGA